MSAIVEMVDDRRVIHVPFESVEEAMQYAANLSVSVGTINYGDGEVEYSGYVGEHFVGAFEDPHVAHIEAARFDRRNLIR